MSASHSLSFPVLSQHKCSPPESSSPSQVGLLLKLFRRLSSSSHLSLIRCIFCQPGYFASRCHKGLSEYVTSHSGPPKSDGNVFTSQRSLSISFSSKLCDGADHGGLRLFWRTEVL